jgi:hypothetical protein
VSAVRPGNEQPVLERETGALMGNQLKRRSKRCSGARDERDESRMTGSNPASSSPFYQRIFELSLADTRVPSGVPGGLRLERGTMFFARRSCTNGPKQSLKSINFPRK